MLPDSFWTIDRIALLGTDTDAAIAKLLGIPKDSVFSQRTLHGIPAYGKPGASKWGETELALLRNYTDREIAKITSRSLQEIAAKRREVSK